jgi:hypothetical protein
MGPFLIASLPTGKSASEGVFQPGMIATAWVLDAQTKAPKQVVL